MSEMNDFRDYVEEQQHLCYGVEGGTPGVHGSLARQYDFLLETIDTYQEIEQPQLSENQQIVLERLKEMMVSFDLCNAIHRLERAEDWGYSKEPYDIAYESLNDKQRRQVVQEACQWAQGQEE
ncbi:hypothetical protein [Enterococcus sp. AZ012]|uniref:hypothetical protein n=1 Tax=unclassified Enterococcus TaxID=2608891 RepID=UPI003D2E228A